MSTRMGRGGMARGGETDKDGLHRECTFLLIKSYFRYGVLGAT